MLSAMARIPRHRFLPAELRHWAYADRAVSIGERQTISQPYMVALMTELLAVRASDRVLEIGTGSGYQTAVLAELAAEVHTIERHAVLADRARNLLRELGYARVTVIVGDGTQGHSDAAPYDAILVSAAFPEVPEPLVDQLRVGGRLVQPIGSGGAERVTVFRRIPDGLVSLGVVADARFVRLYGRHGYK